ncbi:MAG: hypothetical protein V3U98_11605, partial [Acidobacteriota bacterium]
RGHGKKLMSDDHFEPGLDFFESLRPSSGATQCRRITVGPFSVHLRGLSEDCVPPLEERYLGFVDKDFAPGVMRLPLLAAGVPSFLARYGDERGIYLLRVRPEDGRILVYAHDFAAWFDPQGRAGALAVCSPGWEGLRVPIENFLRIYCAWRAVDLGGLLIHAASIVRDGRTHIFFGHSGAGKSTVSTLSCDSGFVLSDDLTLLTPGPDGYLAHSVPFRSTYKGRVVSERRAYPVAGMYQLVQAPQTRLEQTPRAIAVSSVLSCLPFVTDHLLPMDPTQMMGLLERVLREIPVFRLEFTRSADFWGPVLERNKPASV